MRPAEFAQFLLASDGGPPRARARDQQADRAGEDLRRHLLGEIASTDPPAEAMETTLLDWVQSQGEACGPARGIAASVWEEWRMLQSNESFRDYLIREALHASEPGRRRRGPTP